MCTNIIIFEKVWSTQSNLIQYMNTDLYVKKGSPCNICDRRADLLASMDHVDSKRVHRIPSDVIPVDSRDEHLALVVVHEEAAYHFLQKQTYQL